MLDELFTFRSMDMGVRDDHTMLHLYDSERRRSSGVSPRRTSGASSVSGIIFYLF
jgi:hypothetical protein